MQEKCAKPDADYCSPHSASRCVNHFHRAALQVFFFTFYRKQAPESACMGSCVGTYQLLREWRALLQTNFAKS